jgi:hypothetical protein
MLTASPKPRRITSAIARSAGLSSICATLGQVLTHIHDGKIEVLEGSEWPFCDGQLQ